jgi:hypothetical protein
MAPYRALEDLSHDPKLAEALGNMLVAWAHAEILIICTFARVTGIGLNMALEAYHRISNFESRIKFTLALIPEWRTDKFNKDEIATAVEKLAKLSKVRNHWVHGDWCANAGKTETVVFDHRSPLTSPKRRKPVKTADVLNHCAAVKERAAKLGELIRWTELDI